MDLNNLDKDLIRKIKNHSVDLDKEKLWAAIQTKKKKKRGVIIYLIPALLLIVLVGGYFITSSNDLTETKVNSYKTELISGEDVSEIKDALSIETGVSSSENTDQKTTELVQKDITETTEVNKPAALKKPTNSVEQLSISEPTKNEKEVKVNKPLKSAILNSTLPSQSQYPYTDNILTAPRNIESVNEPTKNKQIQNVIISNKNNGFASQFNIPLLDGIKYMTLTSMTAHNNLKPIFSIYERPSIIHEKTSMPFEISFLAGFGYVDRKLSTGVPSLSEASPLAIRQESETPLEEFSADLQLNIPIKGSFYLKSGISYSQINEKMVYSDIREESVLLEDQVTNILIDMEGFSQETRGSVEAIASTQYNFTNYNKYRSIDIPIILGYRLLNDTWSMGLEAGIFWNSNFSFDGSILDTETSLADTENMFKSRHGIKYTGALSLSRKLSDKIRWKLSPSIVFGQGAINTEENPVDQSYNLLRIQTGISYAF